MTSALQTSATAGTVIDQGEAPSYYFKKFLEDNPVFGFITWRWILMSRFDHMFSSPVFLGLLVLLHLHNPIAHGKGCMKMVIHAFRRKNPEAGFCGLSSPSIHI